MPGHRLVKASEVEEGEACGEGVEVEKRAGEGEGREDGSDRGESGGALNK